jgi:hypothetical protein
LSMKVAGLAVLGFALAGSGAGSADPGSAPAGEPRTLYFFFTPESDGAPEAARRVAAFVKERKGAVRLRPVLLVSDFSALGKVSEKTPVHRAIKELGALGTLNIPLYDEEGLALAEHWRIRSVPAFVLVGSRRAHSISGGTADLGSLLECRE